MKILKKTKTLSIVIPVYNVERYIERCLLSCTAQGYSSDDYEILVIDDGTPDCSMDIVYEIQMRYPNLISTYLQTNQGLSVARNVGLEKSKGKYVWFVDSDDWIEPGCLQQIIPALMENDGVDLFQIQYRLVYDDATLTKDADKFLIKGVLSGREVIRKGGLPTPAQFTIYRKLFLDDNNLRFLPGVYHEDSEFKPRATYLADQIISLNAICYNYYQRQIGSITSSFRFKNFEDIIVVVNKLYDFSCATPISCRRYFYRFIGMSMNSLLYGIRQFSREENSQVKEKLCKQKHIFASMCLSMNLKYFIEGLFLSLNVNFGMWLHRLFR